MRSWILGRRWEGRLWSASWELSKTADKMGVVRRYKNSLEISWG